MTFLKLIDCSCGMCVSFCNVLLFLTKKQTRLSKEATRLFWGELLIVTSLPNVILLLKFHWCQNLWCISLYSQWWFYPVFDPFFDTFLGSPRPFFSLQVAWVWVVKPHGCPHSWPWRKQTLEPTKWRFENFQMLVDKDAGRQEALTLQGINISHLGKLGKSSSKVPFWGGYVSSLEGIPPGK